MKIFSLAASRCVRQKDWRSLVRLGSDAAQSTILNALTDLSEDESLAIMEAFTFKNAVYDAINLTEWTPLFIELMQAHEKKAVRAAAVGLLDLHGWKAANPRDHCFYLVAKACIDICVLQVELEGTPIVSVAPPKSPRKSKGWAYEDWRTFVTATREKAFEEVTSSGKDALPALWSVPFYTPPGSRSGASHWDLVQERALFSASCLNELSLLKEVILNGSNGPRKYAASYLGNISTSEAVPLLGRMLLESHSKEMGLRGELIKALGRAKVPEGIGFIDQAIPTMSSIELMFAIQALATIGTGDALPALRKVLSLPDITHGFDFGGMLEDWPSVHDFAVRTIAEIEQRGKH